LNLTLRHPHTLLSRYHPGAGHRRSARPTPRPTQLRPAGPLPQLPLSGGLLGPAPTRKSPRSSITSATSFRGWASSSPHGDEPGRRSLPQPTGDRGALDQGGQDRTHLDAALLPPLPGQRGAPIARGLRRLVLPVAIQNWSLTSLQQRLFKIGGRLFRHARYFVLQLAEGHLIGSLFRQILRAHRGTAVPPRPDRADGSYLGASWRSGGSLSKAGEAASGSP